ncbi:unnamed protein product, partial [marine sediment metagenome]
MTGDWTPTYPDRDPGVREAPFFRPPGYPYLLATAYRLGGLRYAAPRIIQIILGIVGCLLAALFARRWYGAGVGLVAAVLMSTYWVLIYFEGELHAPALLIVLLWAMVSFVARWTERMRFGSAVAAGILLGLAALVRPNVLALAPAILVWAAWIARRHRLGRCYVWAGAGLLAGMAATIAPVTVRNYAVSGDFVLISSNGGINFFIGNNADATGQVADRIRGLGRFGNCF